MPGEPFSRRRFLGGSARIALGATGLAAAGGAGLLEGLAAPAAASERRLLERAGVTSLTSPPPEPPPYHTFVSRPDLRPPGVSVVTASGYTPSTLTPKYIFLTPQAIPMPTNGAQRGLVIIDRAGRLVWFLPRSANGQAPFNFRVQAYNHNPVLTWWEGYVGPGYGLGGTGMIWDSTYSKLTTVTSQQFPMDLHELLLTSEGTALVTAYEERTSLTMGHAQEIDVATGAKVFGWRSYPAVLPSESYNGGLTGHDYFHINSIDLWPGSQRNLLISSRNCCAVYLIDRATKAVIWRLRGKKSTFASTWSAQFWYQHDARALADGSGISLFDDASQPCPEHQSRAKTIRLDEKTRTATLIEEERHDTIALDVGSQGNNQLLPDGSRFVGWGAAPYFSQYAAPGSPYDRAMVFDGRLPSGLQNYRAFCCDWVGNPAQAEIALVVKPGSSSGSFDAYVSWNGATEVHLWRIEAGPSDTQLADAASRQWAGLETHLAFTYSGATAFRATALDVSGSVIGMSQVVSAS